MTRQSNENPATRAVAARSEARNEGVAEFYDRMATVQPTPTQEENDLARVGALNIDEKEDDGSEWDADHQQRVMSARLPGNSPYDTRVAEATGDGDEGSTTRRGGRRAKASEE